MGGSTGAVQTPTALGVWSVHAFASLCIQSVGLQLSRSSGIAVSTAN